MSEITCPSDRRYAVLFPRSFSASPSRAGIKSPVDAKKSRRTAAAPSLRRDSEHAPRTRFLQGYKLKLQTRRCTYISIAIASKVARRYYARIRARGEQSLNSWRVQAQRFMQRAAVSEDAARVRRRTEGGLWGRIAVATPHSRSCS